MGETEHGLIRFKWHGMNQIVNHKKPFQTK